MLIFSDRPHIPLLQWLARGSLKQNLHRSIRLWAWLCYLYRDDCWNLSEPFSFVDLRKTFFTFTHPKEDAIPDLHDRNCICSKTIAEWIFAAKTGVSETEWRSVLQSHDDIPDATLDELLQRRLFAVTRRSLSGDLQILTELGWLKRRGQKYYRVSQFPERPMDKNIEDTTRISTYNFNFLHPDLANIAQNLSQQVGEQRFNLHVDYVIPKSTLDRVDDWQYQLRHLWEQTPVPPVKLTYKSARVGQKVQCIVYPVCVYYVQRAVYLCAFGQTPINKGEWYNYRLDRISQMLPLNWKDSSLPQLLRNHYPHHLPKPDYVEEQMAKAWGFDFYLQPKLMLLRFDREFDDRYIQGTFRHETFQRVTYHQAEKLIKQNTQVQKLLQVLHSRSPHDAYYQVYYRDGDTNVGLRLRAWRPKGEVLLPWELRQSIAKEVQQESQVYNI
ncbi:TIGR03985 family CRISPR-associated protein [Scytonema sp. PRP1]|uniref:TIGR03985 family CRISPR-associated protein n=1 Tax=Scytonema sp. PRP1 TaxID=3120513 RepID=UPI002FCE8EB8